MLLFTCKNYKKHITLVLFPGEGITFFFFLQIIWCSSDNYFKFSRENVWWIAVVCHYIRDLWIPCISLWICQYICSLKLYIVIIVRLMPNIRVGVLQGMAESEQLVQIIPRVHGMTWAIYMLREGRKSVWIPGFCFSVCYLLAQQN